MPKREPTMDEPDADSLNDSFEHDTLENDDTSTVVQEGRIKTPKCQPPSDETDDDSPESGLDRDDTSTVVQEGRIKNPKRKPPLGEDDDSSLSDSSMEYDENSKVVQEHRTQTPRKVLMGKFIEALDDSSSEHEATLLSETDSLIDEISVELIDSDGKALKTPVKDGMAKHSVTLDNDTENSAWALDAETNEVFLAADRFAIPDVVWPKLRIPIELFNRLYSHQKAGVQWMASLHSNRIGGILGDGT
jgi:hypothetical protein